MKLAALALIALTVAAAPAPDAGPIIIIRHQDVPLVTVYAWERWGNFINALAGSKTEIPYDAARLQVKVYTFPSGEIRAIRFANGVRTHRHINQTDTILYSWQAHRVQFVNDMAVVTEPGDFALHEKGVYHSGEEIRRGGGIDLEFAFTYAGVHNDPTAYWSRGVDHPLEPAAAWISGSGPVEVVGTSAVTKAPPNAVRYQVRDAVFQSYTAREVRLAAGTTMPFQVGPTDRILFVLSGNFRLSGAKAASDLESEDAAQVPTKGTYTLTALTAGTFVEAERR